MIKHQLQISVSGERAAAVRDDHPTRDKPARGPRNVLECRRLTLRDKVLGALFGRGQRVLVLIPSSSVQTVTIKEVEEGQTE